MIIKIVTFCLSALSVVTIWLKQIILHELFLIFYTFNITSTYLIKCIFTFYTNRSYFHVKNAPVTQSSYLNQLFHIRALFGVIISCSTLNLPKIREKLAAGFT